MRASLLATYTDEQFLVRSLGLHLRDFVRNENTVSPHRWALNCSRVVMMRGHERILEWKLFLILLLRAQQNEFNQTVLCIRTGGVYNVPQVTSDILSGCQPFRLCSQISLFLNIVSKETSILHCITALCTV